MTNRPSPTNATDEGWDVDVDEEYRGTPGGQALHDSMEVYFAATKYEQQSREHRDYWFTMLRELARFAHGDTEWHIGAVEYGVRSGKIKPYFTPPTGTGPVA